MLRNFWLQPGNLGSAMLFENQERGKEAYWGEKMWVVSTVVVSKGLLNTSGRCLGFFISICNSLYQREEPPESSSPFLAKDANISDSCFKPFLREIQVSQTTLLVGRWGAKRLRNLSVPVGALRALAVSSPGFSL